MATADILNMDKKADANKQKALDSALAQIERQFGKGSIMKLGGENAIQEIEDHLKAIENDDSLPSSEEQSAYKSHFASHNNSLDSISDFAYGRHGEVDHSSQNHDGTHEPSHHSHHSHHSEHSHEAHEGRFLDFLI